VFAHDVDDAWRVFSEIACFDPLDGYSRKVPGLGLLRGAPRIGVPDHLEFFGDAAASQAFRAALDTLSTRLSLEPQPIDFQPLKQVCALLYDGPWVAERRAALGAFFDTHHDAIDPVVAAVIGKADGYSAVDAFDGQYALVELKRRAEQLFEAIDVLIVPTAPTQPLIADVQANPVELNSQLGYYTNFVNLLDLCALAVPCQRRHDGLPAGITLIAPSGADRRLAELGARIQALFAGGNELPSESETAAVAEPTTRIATAANALEPLPFQEPTVALAVVGAHLRGQPLNWQLPARASLWRRIPPPITRFTRLRIRSRRNRASCASPTGKAHRSPWKSGKCRCAASANSSPTCPRRSASVPCNSPAALR
jgi:allophanate hydrolase